LTLYAETSVLLRWILGQEDAEAVRKALSRAARVVTSSSKLHLATALALEATVGPLQILSTDARVVHSARALGFSVLPEGEASVFVP
jgi:hypothetical protein